MSIIDHSPSYEQRYSTEKQSEELTGKFFWFSGFSLPFQKQQSYEPHPVEEEINPIEESENLASPYFDDERIYDAPFVPLIKEKPNNEHDYHDPNILSPSATANPDSLYEIPVDQSLPAPEYEYHHYELPDVVRNSEKPRTFSKHNYESPDLQNHEYQNQTIINEFNEEMSPTKVHFHDNDINDETSPSYDGRFFKLKEKDSSDENDYVTANEPNQTDDYVTHEESPKHHRKHSGRRKQENYATGMWFGFSGRNHTAESLENLLDIDRNDAAVNNEPELKEEIINSVESEPLYTTFDDIPDFDTNLDEGVPPITATAKENNSSELDNQFLEIEKLVFDTFNGLELEDDIDAPPEVEIKPVQTENLNKSPTMEIPEQSWNVNLELSPDSEFRIASPDQEINSPRDIMLNSFVNENMQKKNNDHKKNKLENYHRQETFHFKDEITTPEVESPNSPNSTTNIEVGKSYNIEIIPDAKHLDIESEHQSYHVAFVKKDENKGPENMDTKQSQEVNKEIKDDNINNNKKIDDRNISKFKSEEMPYSTSSLPRPARRSDVRPFQKSYSLKETRNMPRPELRKNDSFDGRRRSSHMNRHQDEPIGFSSLKNMFEPTRIGEEKYLPRNKLSPTSKTTSPEKNSNKDNVPNSTPNKKSISGKSFDESDVPKRPAAPINYEKPKKLKEMSKSKAVVVDDVFTSSIVGDVQAEMTLNDLQRKSTKSPERAKTPELSVLPQRRISIKSKKPSTTTPRVVATVASPSPRNLRRSKDDSDKPRISVTSQQAPKIKQIVRSKSFGEKPRPSLQMKEEVITQSPNEMKIFYQLQKNRSDNVSDRKSESNQVNDNPKNLKRKTKSQSNSSLPRSSDISSDEDTENLAFNRGTSFRRSIVIEDEVNEKKRKQSQGEKFVSVFFTPINPSDIASGQTSYSHQFRNILTYLDKMIIHVELFADQFDAVKQLHSLFWDLKDNEEKVRNEKLTGVLNHLVSHEWPKILLGCLKKLHKSYKHVFHQTNDPESIIYYSGHMPSLLRMNRTSSEFAMAVIFDGILKTAINFTDVHEASRVACCEENLIGYLIEEVLPLLHGIHWGKNTARESFLKSICDLIYNCAQDSKNAPYLIKHGVVEVYNVMLSEMYDVVEAKKVFMTIMLAMSYLIDSNTNDVIIPSEGYIIRVLQFLDKSLEHSEHTYLDFFSAELTGCLSRLAAHDANKYAITRNSGQEILHKVIKHAYDDEEKIEACNALWNLAFNHEAKNTLRYMNKLLNALRQLKGSTNVFLKRAANGVLWECEDKYDLKGSRETNVALPNHVMISYELETQPIVIAIRDELQRRGFSVWMNSDVDERSLQEIMTRGVECSSVFVMALSRKYKQTPHCFAEVDYANKLHKDIIPIIIDNEYTVDGWLSKIIESRRTFDFSKPAMHHGSTDALIEYIQETTQKMSKGDLSTDANKVDRGKDIVLWTNDDVISWLKENNLIKSAKKNDRLEKLTGLHLTMFHDLKKESPDYYYSVLDSHLGFKDVLRTMEFSYALDQLLGNERLI